MKPRILSARFPLHVAAAVLLGAAALPIAHAAVGLGVPPPTDAEVLFDGRAETLHDKWIYWAGPRAAAKGAIQWPLVEDPVDGGLVLSSDDPAVPKAPPRYGYADIVTKKPYRDFRLHVEFMVMGEGGNSGVYLQNRYEIQVQDGDATMHGMGSVINETPSPYFAYRGLGQWNAYDLVFRAARFKDGQLVERARVTLFFNGIKVHNNVQINKVWGGAASGIDGGNDDGRGITDTPGGLKLQAEGHDVRYRNIWIRELNLDDRTSNFQREQ